jgi:segregation and condensation protein A
MTSFEIKLPLFEGPFDLLLFFIERDELDIHDIPIAKITVDFLDYMQQAEQLNMEIVSEFILVAATLMRIKAKMLLPRPVLDEVGQEIDPRAELVEHLLAYKQYKILAEELAVLETERLGKEARGNAQTEINLLASQADAEAAWQDLDLYKLLKLYIKVMDKFKAEQNKPVHKIVPYAYTIENQRLMILDLIAKHDSISFLQLMKQAKGNKIETIFNFLAILDLLQQGSINIAIGEAKNEFWLTKKVILAA